MFPLFYHLLPNMRFLCLIIIFAYDKLTSSIRPYQIIRIIFQAKSIKIPNKKRLYPNKNKNHCKKRRLDQHKNKNIYKKRRLDQHKNKNHIYKKRRLDLHKNKKLYKKKRFHLHKNKNHHLSKYPRFRLIVLLVSIKRKLK
jgi:hypothetical protein